MKIGDDDDKRLVDEICSYKQMAHDSDSKYDCFSYLNKARILCERREKLLKGDI